MHLFDYRCFLRPPRWPPRPGPAQAGWRASWLAQIRPDPAMPASRRRRKSPPWHCRGRGASGGSLYDGYRLVPGSSRPAGVVTRSRGLARGARELDSTSIVRPSACRGHAAGRPAEAIATRLFWSVHTGVATRPVQSGHDVMRHSHTHMPAPPALSPRSGFTRARTPHPWWRAHGRRSPRDPRRTCASSSAEPTATG